VKKCYNRCKLKRKVVKLVFKKEMKMIVKELIEMLNKVLDKNKKVMLSVEYGYGENLYVSDVSVSECDDVVNLWGEEDVNNEDEEEEEV
jgi:hypothetical protein